MFLLLLAFLINCCKYLGVDSDVASAKYIGTAVAMYFDGYPKDTPFCGRLVNARPVGKNADDSVIYYMAEFPPQLGDKGFFFL